MDSMMRGARVADVSLDCEDHRQLAVFYARLLNGRVDWMTDTAAGIAVGSYSLVARRVSPYTRPTWPGTSIVHLDLTCEPQDLPAFRTHAEQRGTELALHQPDERWVVMLDPAGHSFCLTPFANLTSAMRWSCASETDTERCELEDVERCCSQVRVGTRSGWACLDCGVRGTDAGVFSRPLAESRFRQ